MNQLGDNLLNPSDQRLDEETVRDRMRTLSEEVFSIAKAQILVKLRFLDRAMFELTPTDSEEYPLATDGKHLWYEPHFLLKSYRQNAGFVMRAWAHMLMHCLFRHMFIQPSVDQVLWDLASDIAAEAMARELALPQLLSGPGQDARNKVLDQLAEKVKPLTAEKLMSYFRQHPLDGPTEQHYRDLFTVDSHDLWYVTQEEKHGRKQGSGGDDEEEQEQQQRRQEQKSREDQDQEKDPEQNEDSDASGQDEHQDEDQNGNDESQTDQDENQGEDQNGNDESQSGQDGEKDGDGSPDQNDGRTDGATADRLSSEQRQELESMWRDISERVQTDLETFTRQHGFESGAMTQALRSLNREHYDYRAFLQKFATRTEVMKLSPDEFDYVFYTYGLSLYRDMPLIEPLEYRDEKRIRDFVIAIDTSGSCSGEVVQMFLQKTYTILKQEETFDRRFHMHLIQCDAQIQEDAVITTQEEFDDYIAHMKLHGFGGTDFRPVFTYVEQLQNQHVFRDLRGLIYFTDGYGTYPKKQPGYMTAFVFLDDNDTGMHLVPSWAIRLVLESEDVRRA